MGIAFSSFGDEAHPRSAAEIKRLLADCELPFQDLTPSHLAHFMIARDGDQIVGTVGLELLGRSGLLRSLAVAAPYRRKGIATELTRRAEAYAGSQGVGTLYLLTTTAERFFARRGYRSLARDAVPAAVQATAEFQSLCPDTAVCMSKHLDL
jgi:amino-acid N-acetyltransferase